MNLNQKLIDLLVKLGLSRNEARFYIFVYKNPGLELKDIAEKLKLSKATVYRVYEKLRERGVVFSSQNTWKKSISVLSLNRLADQVSKNIRNMGKVEFALRDVASLMEMEKFALNFDPIQVFTEKNEILDQAFRILHKNWDTVLAFGSAERLIDILGWENESNFMDIRIRKGKKAFAYLTEIGDYAKELKIKNESDDLDLKVRVDDRMQSSMTYIYGDEAMVWHKSEGFGLRLLKIQDPVLVENYRNQFHFVWNS